MDMSDNLESLNVGKLLFECAKRQIKGFQKKEKPELIQMIRDHDSATGKDDRLKPKKKDKEKDIDLNDDDDDLDGDAIEDKFTKMSRKKLKLYIKKHDLKEKHGVRVMKSDTEDDLRDKIRNVNSNSNKGDGMAKKKASAKKGKKSEKKTTKDADGRGRKITDRKALINEHGSPFRKNTAFDILYRVVVKAGAKGASAETICSSAKKAMAKNKIKCASVESRFSKLISVVDDTKGAGKIIQNDKKKYLLKK